MRLGSVAFEVAVDTASGDMACSWAPVHLAVSRRLTLKIGRVGGAGCALSLRRRPVVAMIYGLIRKLSKLRNNFYLFRSQVFW